MVVTFINQRPIVVSWTPKRIETLRNAIEAGKSANDLAAFFGMTRSALLKAARRTTGLAPVDKRARREAWPAERDAELKKRWGEGASAAKIAEELGITRNAVIGRAHRLKLETRGHSVGGRPRSAHKKVRTPRPAKIVVPAVIDEAIPLEQRKHFLDLTPRCCRWPVGDTQSGFWGGDLFFCGAVAAEGRSYCASHYERSVFRP